MIAELIDEYWERLRSTVDLSRLSCEQKLRLFRETVIVFPFLSVPDQLKTEDVGVDFCSRASDRSARSVHLWQRSAVPVVSRAHTGGRRGADWEILTQLC